ncbi:uncharacterized protein SPSC_04517 [Sporisorium scitamineum]|uniref:Uncharacterized protein n=1 Tax=Sporisorium scitamineum TaxID=49012 RepID=A0A0F7RVI7_9BASI|nr:hypothetical protein [Sporisorium scitamineum]CDU24684.1 uncharacterized protein SPSC_04517 [Sporisorium scitamineum]
MRCFFLLALAVLATSAIAAPMWFPPADAAEKAKTALDQAAEQRLAESLSSLGVNEGYQRTQAATRAFTGQASNVPQPHVDSLHAMEPAPSHEHVSPPRTYHSDEEASLRTSRAAGKRGDWRLRLTGVQASEEGFKKSSRRPSFFSVVQQALAKQNQELAEQGAVARGSSAGRQQPMQRGGRPTLQRQSRINNADLKSLADLLDKS